MKHLKIKVLFLILFFIPVFSTHAQTGTIRADTVRVTKESKSEETVSNSKAGAVNGANSQAIKQVKGARPDMSKARGARPPQITRPSGSVVPRGIGKPGGAGRRGGP